MGQKEAGDLSGIAGMRVRRGRGHSLVSSSQERKPHQPRPTLIATRRSPPLITRSTRGSMPDCSCWKVMRLAWSRSSASCVATRLTSPLGRRSEPCTRTCTQKQAPHAGQATSVGNCRLKHHMSRRDAHNTPAVGPPKPHPRKPRCPTPASSTAAVPDQGGRVR